MRRYLPYVVLFLGACASTPIPKDDPNPPTGAWFEVALNLDGSNANPATFGDCVEVARQSGIRVTHTAPIRINFDLSSERNELEVFQGTERVLARTLPGWSMSALCTAAFAAALPAQIAPSIAKLEPPPSCQPAGVVEGKHQSFSGPANSEAATADLILQAAHQGLNYVVVDGMRQPAAALIYVGGRGFRCPAGTIVQSPPGQPAFVPPSAPGACVPDCSPGYVCMQGACVSACNPACAPNQQCGADRICH